VKNIEKKFLHPYCLFILFKKIPKRRYEKVPITLEYPLKFANGHGFP